MWWLVSRLSFATSSESDMSAEVVPAADDRMNAWQKAVARTYADGDFANLIDDPQWRQQLPLLGDTLFSFIMIELSDREGCDSLKEAVDRLSSAREDVEQALIEVLCVSGTQ